jgi:triosephosphate isomerase (TIM)
MRKKIVAGNWKMNLTLREGYELAKSIRSLIENESQALPEVILCTPFTHLKGVADILEGSGIGTGSQNCSAEPSGAFTGEISVSMIKSTGALWTLVGHSERRTLYGENDFLLLKKTNAALDAGLGVIFCCGEILAERESKVHFDTVRKQLNDGLFSLPAERFGKTVIAYEPVWAIGTGVTASPQQAQEMHAFIREIVAGKYGSATADDTTILYGGSCKASNAAELFGNSDVDGGLIGGASLKADEFFGIIKALIA